METENKFQDRKRQNKKKFKKIKKQMEFYFSDSNLGKDKFLQDLVRKSLDGYVDLEVFKSFNKIKAITQNVEDIAVALSKSEDLQISNDGQKVHRITPLPEFKDFDACTIYVENLPLHADQKWMRDVFERFGSIAHVNVPHFRVSRKIKGFAFVEFDSSDSVKKACEAFKHMQTDESNQTDETIKEKKSKKKKKFLESMHHKKTSETEFLKIKKISASDVITDKEEKNILMNLSNEELIQGQESSEMESSDVKHLSLPVKRGSKKRKQNLNESDISSKKIKMCSAENKKSDIKSLTECETNRLQPEELKVEEMIISSKEEISHMDQNEYKGEENTKSSNRRKRHIKNRSNTDTIHLRVMTKADWKVYRNKFLALQRATLSHLKKTIMLETQHLQELEPDTGETDVLEAAKPSLQFISGVIIKITLQNPIVSSTGIKDQVKSNAVVAYIDAPVGHTEAHVRCYNSEDAKTIISEGKLNHLGSLEVLKDIEEKNYWEKLENDRKNKFNSSQNQKKRGRDKIIAKAAKITEQKNKHMYFDY